jgi:phage FluMu protein Com
MINAVIVTCPHCEKHVVSVENGSVISLQVKCPFCKKSFGYHRIPDGREEYLG